MYHITLELTYFYSSSLVGQLKVCVRETVDQNCLGDYARSNVAHNFGKGATESTFDINPSRHACRRYWRI